MKTATEANMTNIRCCRVRSRYMYSIVSSKNPKSSIERGLPKRFQTSPIAARVVDKSRPQFDRFPLFVNRAIDDEFRRAVLT